MNRYLSNLFSGLSTELRSEMRGLVRKPGYAIAAWIMLGLAVAANAAVFAIVYGFLLKPLPYAQPSQLAIVRERVPGIGLNTPLVSVKTYLALKQGLSGITSAGLSTNPNDDVATIDGHPHMLLFQEVTPSLFSTLGVAPALGRLPAADADQPGGPPEAVISWRFWRSAFNGSDTVLAQSFKLEGKTYRIVGVMPKDFFIQQGGFDAWLPFVMTPQQAQDDNINYWMIVRRKPGVSSQLLNLELQTSTQRLLADKTPKERVRYIQDGYTIDARSPHSVVLANSGIGTLPWLMQAAAGLLLLLALANTINLGLVRQGARQHEFALRHALGASRSRLLRLILIEHLPIVAAVGIVATLLAWAGVNALHSLGLPPALSPFKVEFAAPIVTFTWALTILAILIAALGPALLASGRHLIAALGYGRTTTGGRSARRLQRSLGVIQIALACALLIAGGLLGTSLLRILTQPLGFSPQNRVAITVVTPDNGTSQTATWAALKPELLKLPGVRNAAVTGMVPFSGDHDQGGVSKIGATNSLIVEMPLVSASYFSTMGIPLLAGRAFTSEEIADKARVVVINEALAKHFFGSADQAIGQSLDVGNEFRIVGVTPDVRWDPTPDEYRFGTAYFRFGAFSTGFNVIVRTNGPSGPWMNPLRNTILRALPGSVVSSITPLSDVVRGASVFRAAGAGMVGAFAALALLLAALGVFAITAFIAHARLGEYGIRAALGATPAALLRLGFRDAAWLLVIGVPIGLIGAYLLGRLVASALYQTPVLDPWLYIVGVLIIVAVVFAAAWRPARRAARIPVRQLLGGGGAQ